MILKTERLILRKPKKNDWKDIFNACQDKNFAKKTKRIPHPFMKKDAKKFIEKSLSKWKNKEYSFFIELKSEKKIIGFVELSDIRKFNETAETISWIDPKYQRRGYMLESKIAINNFAFNILKLRKVSSYMFSDNMPSIAVQKKMGYEFEGRMLKDCRDISTGKIHNIDIYSLFKSNWKKVLPKLRKDLIKKLNS